MTEHYTRNTESATAWCAKCSRRTDHRVDNGRLGPCIDPNHPSGIPRAVIPPLDLPKVQQGDLFAPSPFETQGKRDREPGEEG